MECLVTRFMVMILREFGVNPPRIKVEMYMLWKWKDEITFGNASSFTGPSTPSISSSGASSSSRPSRAALSLGNAECSNCKLLTIKIKILEARLAMERHPEDHACQSVVILHELMNEMENLHVE
ncbi:hypothetical protein Tco_1499824 [Tanacetum coccineum]